MPAGDGGARDTGERPLSLARAAGGLLVVGLLARVAGPAPSPAWAEPPVPDEPPAAAPARAEATPPRRAEQVTVTATRQPSRIEDAPASVAVLPRAALDATAAPTLDDALRQVVGFSLFRRSGSRFANPTSQGVSLRGLGASGASRALVLVDGLPLNDPFGGWVHWARVPRLSLERLEVLRGGASDLYGSTALGGVVQAVTREPAAGPALDAEASGGGLGTYDGSLSAAGTRGAWGGRFSGQLFHTDGYVPVEEASRGAVDVAAWSRHAAGDASLERRIGQGRLFARASAFGEDRGNGTPLQVNDTRVVVGALGADWGEAGRGAWTARGWGQSQLYHQSFSALSADRAREDLTRLQRVPATAFGASLQRSQAIGSRQRLLVGADARSVDGTTQETAYARGVATSRVEAGGRERTAAVFAEDLLQLGSRALLAGSLRLDGWWHDGGRSTTTPLAGGASASDRLRRPQRDCLEPASRPARARRLRPLADGLGLRRLPRADAQRALPVVPARRHAHARQPGAVGRAAVGRRGGRAPAPGPRNAARDGVLGGGARRRGERDGLDDAVPDHARAAQRRPPALARPRGRGRAASRSPRRAVRRLRAHGLARRCVRRRPRARGQGRPAGAAAPADRAGPLRRGLEARDPGALDGLGLRGRPQPAGPRSRLAGRRAGRARAAARPRGVPRGRERVRRAAGGRAHAGRERRAAAHAARGRARACRRPVP